MSPDKIRTASNEIRNTWTEFVDEEVSDAAFKAIAALNALADLVDSR